MKILGTGLSGMVGSRVTELLGDRYAFANLSLETGVDITDGPSLRRAMIASPASWVWHFAAQTDVDRAEREREEGTSGTTWRVNTGATQEIARICRETGKRLLYISTDYVFDGSRPRYTEEDIPHPLGWYGVTKYEGECAVAVLGDRALILRIANPYGPHLGKKPDFVGKIREKLAKGQEISSPSDQLFMPTYIDDIARAIDSLVRNDAHGLYHVVGEDALSPYGAARCIARTFGYDESLVKETSFARYFRGRAPRPFHAVLEHDKITKFGIRMSTFEEGLKTLGAVGNTRIHST
ncbi:SDR family oxidoreductase [Patescibacteria group bacterium]|nr:SDR family oxidoreductase [Patescibacteria group bacterium]